MKRNGVVKFRKLYNKEHGIVPQTIQKEIRESIRATHVAEDTETYQENAASHYAKLPKKEREKMMKEMEKEMKEAAKALDFERAAELRDLLFELKAEG